MRRVGKRGRGNDLFKIVANVVIDFPRHNPQLHVLWRRRRITMTVQVRQG